MSKLFECSSAVGGYHYYWKYWQPREYQSLDCVQEKGNPFDYFAIKVMDQDTGTTVGHLLMENSRATKFLLDRGARVISILTSTNYSFTASARRLGNSLPSRDIYVTNSTKQAVD